MSFIPKGILGLASLSGAGCAVGIPLATNSHKEKVTSDEATNLKAVSIEKCENGDFSNQSVVTFGEQNVNGICGKIEENGKDNTKINSLLQKVGGKTSSGSSLQLSDFQFYCRQDAQDNEQSAEGSEEGFALGKERSGNCQDKEYLVVGQSNSSKIFLKNSNGQHGNEYKIGLCMNQCGISGKEFKDSLEQQSVDEQITNWKEVKFYKK